MRRDCHSSMRKKKRKKILPPSDAKIIFLLRRQTTMMMTKALLASVAHFFLLFSFLLSTTPHHISLHGMADARSPRQNSFIQFIMEFKSQTTAHNTKWMKNLTEKSPCLISLLTLWLWLSSVCWIFAGWWTCSWLYLKLLYIRWAYFFFAIHAQLSLI